MDAKELAGIKLLFHGLHGLMQQVSFPLAADLYVISSRANPVDVLCAPGRRMSVSDGFTTVAAYLVMPRSGRWLGPSGRSNLVSRSILRVGA
jgi:hypothetical protein